jgi:hypothetical protein
MPHDKRLCAALDVQASEPNMRGYAAIVGVFRQKHADFCLIGPPLGLTPISS